MTFDIDANGIIDVTAKDKGTGKIQNIKIESGSSLSEEEIQRMKTEGEQHASEDSAKKEKVEKLNNADALVFQTENHIKEFGDKLDENDKSQLENLIKDLQESSKAEDMVKVEELTNNLNSAWAEISTKLYQETQTTDDVQTPPKEGETTDVEYEEVK